MEKAWTIFGLDRVHEFELTKCNDGTSQAKRQKQVETNELAWTEERQQLVWNPNLYTENAMKEATRAGHQRETELNPIANNISCNSQQQTFPLEIPKDQANDGFKNISKKNAWRPQTGGLQSFHSTASPPPLLEMHELEMIAVVVHSCGKCEWMNEISAATTAAASAHTPSQSEIWNGKAKI